MLIAAAPITAPDLAPILARAMLMARAPAPEPAPRPQVSQRIADTLALLNDTLAPQRRVVHAGDVIHQAGELCFRFGKEAIE